MHMIVIERHFHDHVPKLMSEKLSFAITPFIHLAMVSVSYLFPSFTTEA